MQAKLDASERRQSEPIAVVGHELPFPRRRQPAESFWQLLRDGRDAVTEVPRERWNVDRFYDPDPDAPGKMSHALRRDSSRGVDRFDPHFFGISPREAVSMDPQQRLLLEVCWEALEDAGEPVTSLAGSSTGVFVGITSSDYMQLLGASGAAGLDAYAMTGNVLNFAAGRLFLRARTPGSEHDRRTRRAPPSLVSVHLACQSLRSGESAHGAGGWREPDSSPRAEHRALEGADAGAGRTLQDIRRDRPTDTCAAKAAASSC